MKIIDTKNLPFEKALHGEFKKQIILNDNKVPSIHQFGRVVMKKGEIANDHGHSGQSEVIMIEKGKAKVVFNKN